MAASPHTGTLFDDSDTLVLEGRVERIVYADPEGGWSVIRVLLAESDTQITAVGSLYGVQPGERLRLSGRWQKDRRFGRQFRVEAYLSLLPSTSQGIERYLGSGLIAGIGPVMAKRLVDRFGLDTLEVIEKAPQRLTEVAGIGARRAQRIRQAWQKQKGIREVMVFLQGQGIGFGHAVKIHREYGERAVAVIRANPYRLSAEIHGIGFKTADQIASRLGIAADAEIRAEAGVLQVLAQAESQGHAFLPDARLVQRACELLQQPPEVARSALDRLAQRRGVIAERPRTGRQARAIYLPRLFEAETELAARLNELLAQARPAVEGRWQRQLADFEARSDLRLSDEQQEAVGRSLSETVLIITGGPGTGKTTLIRAVTELLAQQDLRIALGAPTGRAAKRLSESAGFEAKTLHRLLEFDPRALSFQRHRRRPLEADVVIVDETSMLDCALARSLLVALPRGCRLILVGDVDQLPSVGPGRVLGDFIASSRMPVIRLHKVFRQASRSLIVQNAHRIRRGRMPLIESDPSVDFFFIERHRTEEILETVEHLVGERIPRGFGLQPRTDIQLLAPMRKGDVGVEQLNQRMQKLLAADSPVVEMAGHRFRRGDRVMQIRNDYDLEIFNGDIGHVVGPSTDSESLIVDFYGTPVAYPAADTDQLVLAYACSIHKAQGSEYPCVVIPLHTQHHIMLQRNLLYTAVTRGRKLVVVVGQSEALARAVGNSRQQVRFTGLVDRLASP